jgi:glycosyltransferase involved in cell wall biosynthesis
MMSKQGAVVIVNHNAGSPQHGPNLRSYYTAKYLVRRGYSVHIFSSSFSHKYVCLPNVSGQVTKEKIDDIHYYWVRTRPYKGIIGRVWSFRQFAKKLDRVISEHIHEMKVLICSSPPPVFSCICHRIARRYGARFIFDVRDLWPLTILEMGAASRYNPYILYMERLERFAYKNADMVVSALPCSESYMREKGLPESRFCCIQNGTEVGPKPSIDEAELPKDIRKILNGKSPFRVGYAGAFDRSKDLDSFLRAAALLRERDIQFVLVGKGRERRRLASQAAELPNVSILPPVRSDQIQWVLARFDVCYMGLKNKPVFRYGVSLNKQFEYMRAARPILNAINAGNDIVLEANCGISVKPEDAHAIADAVVRFAAMAQCERREIGERGAVYLKANHTYDVLIEDWIQVIEG